MCEAASAPADFRFTDLLIYRVDALEVPAPMARSLMLSFLAPVALVAALFPARPCGASAPRYPDIMPLSQVKAGMRGYGLTVFRGTKIERFDVAVVGVVKKGSLAAPGHDMILVRMFGGPITSRHAYLIRGMSGSPVYINGKIIGAFSQGEPTTKEAGSASLNAFGTSTIADYVSGNTKYGSTSVRRVVFVRPSFEPATTGLLVTNVPSL